MTNFLVVGMQGTIGAELFSRLQTTNAHVWGTSHKPYSSHPANMFYLNLLDDPTTWKFKDIAFDVVYLCAGVCRMALCEEDPATTYQVNITGMSNLTRYLADSGAFIVYLSTNQVFSGAEPFAATTTNYQPMNEYGRQKAEMETFIQTHCKQFAVVRLTKVVEHNMSLIKNWIDQLTNNQSVNAFHDMPLAPVSLNQVIDVLIAIGQKKQTGFYHISGKEDVSYYDLANYLANKLKCPSSLVQSVSALDCGIKKIFLPRFTTLDCSSTIALCGQQPPHFSKVLQECFEIA